jgi:hypothetical protein
MDTMTRMQAAGYRIEEDAAIADLGPGVELRANGLNQFMESCRSQNLDPVHVLVSVFENIKQQPAVQSALAAPPGPKQHLSIVLKNVRMAPAGGQQQ